MMCLRSNKLLYCTKHILNQQCKMSFGASKSLLSYPHIRYKSSNSEKSIVVSRDGSTIYCWHPEPSHPYEHTKPLPRVEAEIQEGESALKVQYLLTDKYRYRPDGPTDPELMEMFSTSKHQWRLKPRRRFTKENPPVDREGI